MPTTESKVSGTGDVVDGPEALTGVEVSLASNVSFNREVVGETEAEAVLNVKFRGLAAGDRRS